ncbi:MAG TPA: hypothetical protein ENI23_10715 [bacterium]|nr:hypothetical protein [bacterium]
MFLSNKILKLFIVLSVVGFVVLAVGFLLLASDVSAQVITEKYDPATADCEYAPDFDPNSPGDCTPPTFRQVEIWVINGLYLIWAFGGLIFLVGLIVIGFQWMTSGGDQQKLEELKKRATYWAISIPIFFGGVPVINTVMNFLPISESATCYESLSQPGFQLVFPNSCAYYEGGCFGDPLGHEYVCDNGNWIKQ